MHGKPAKFAAAILKALGILLVPHKHLKLEFSGVEPTANCPICWCYSLWISLKKDLSSPPSLHLYFCLYAHRCKKDAYKRREFSVPLQRRRTPFCEWFWPSDHRDSSEFLVVLSTVVMGLAKPIHPLILSRNSTGMLWGCGVKELFLFSFSFLLSKTQSGYGVSYSLVQGGNLVPLLNVRDFSYLPGKSFQGLWSRMELTAWHPWPKSLGHSLWVIQLVILTFTLHI